MHLVLTSKDAWDYRPCSPPAVPCDPYPSSADEDVQDILSHEWGHVLGHNEMTDGRGGEQSMNPSKTAPFGSVGRQRVTLALGDIEGLRKLYPCTCPAPTIYRP
jgi:hypothetical protein